MACKRRCPCRGTSEPDLQRALATHALTLDMLQPRSSIYAMFDDLLLLSEGSCLYSGIKAPFLCIFTS